MGKSGGVATAGDYQVELVEALSLIPYARNSRKHSDEQIAKLMANLTEFGFTKPVLVDEKGIVAGHGATLAVLRLAEQQKQIKTPSGKLLPLGQVPIIRCDGWSDAQRRAYIIADNAIAEQSAWDRDILGLEVLELNDLGIDLDLLGFEPADLGKILDAAAAPGGNDGLTDPDEAPPAPQKPVTVTGDVWILGRHRLVCGDSTDADTVAKALNGVRPYLLISDPPYGVNYDADWRTTKRNGDGNLLSTGHDRAVGVVRNDDQADWREAWALAPCEVAYVWHAGLQSGVVERSLQEAGYEIRAQIIWAKNQFVVGRGHYHWQHEACWYAVKKGGKGHWAGDRKQSTLWEIDKAPKLETGHSTQKPVECMRRPMENNSSPGQAVYDPFVGSGTTIIAAEQIGRACHAVELDPAYCDVAVMRWQSFTGETAVLEATGQTWAELLAERQPGATITTTAVEKKPKKEKA